MFRGYLSLHILLRIYLSLTMYKACSFWWTEVTVMHILAFVYTSYLSMISTISCAHTILCGPIISLCLLETHRCIKMGWPSPQSSPHSNPRNTSLMQLWIYIFLKIFSPKENIIMGQPQERGIWELFSRDFHYQQVSTKWKSQLRNKTPLLWIVWAFFPTFTQIHFHPFKYLLKTITT